MYFDINKNLHFLLKTTLILIFLYYIFFLNKKNTHESFKNKKHTKHKNNKINNSDNNDNIDCIEKLTNYIGNKKKIEQKTKYWKKKLDEYL